jgi:hypothetical protein
MQFVHQLPQPGRQFGFGTEATLQPFTNRIADGLAGPVIDLFEIAVDLGVHGNSLCPLDVFRFAAALV